MTFSWPESKFTTKEFACPCGCGFGSKPEDVSQELIFKLNIIRHWYGNPMIVKSGARCAQYNAGIGGEVNSAHLPHPATRQCRAADIYVPDSAARFKLIKHAHHFGIERMGDGQRFLHLDVAWDLPRPVSWVYE